MRQQADPANLVIEKVGGNTVIWIKPPYTASEKHQMMLADQAALNRVLRLNLWATKAVEDGKPSADVGLEEAFDEMVALDADDLFDEMAPTVDLKRHNTQSAVSATAAVLARHGSDALWEKAQEKVADIAQRAATIVETHDELSFRGTHLTGHPPAMAAVTYAALLRRDPSRREARVAMFQLAVDPVEAVVEAVYDAAPIFVEAAPDMVWRLFSLATQRAARSHETEHSPHWSPAEAKEQSALADEAEQMLIGGVLPSAHPVPTTAGARGWNDSYYWSFHENALRLPIEPMLDFATHDALIKHAESALDQALASLGKGRERSGAPHEWLHACGRWLARLVALIPPAEAQTLLFARLDAAERLAAIEVMDTVMSHFMLHRMLRKEMLNKATLETWEALVDWAASRPHWGATPVDARRHERGLAVTALFCGFRDDIVCGIDRDWPNLDVVLPALNRAAETFSTEQTVFAALLALLRARSERLFPQPGLGWIQRVVRIRKTEREFWSHVSNGERLALILRELVAADPLATGDREIVIEIADALIEMGIRGAAFLQQDLVRQKR